MLILPRGPKKSLGDTSGTPPAALPYAPSPSPITILKICQYILNNTYAAHFFGRAGFRNELILSIKAHVEVIGRSSRVLGNHHPTTRAIAASLKLCFDEQLDWTLDDDIRKWLWVRRLLDGDFPPDPADFHFPPDPNDVTLDMMRQKVFLKRMNILDGDLDSE